MSKSGMLTRSGFRKRSNSRLYGIGSISVMPSEYATSRAGAGAAARADRDAARLGLADEVPDDQEVPGVLHADDHVELAISRRATVRGLVHRSCRAAVNSAKRFSRPSRET